MDYEIIEQFNRFWRLYKVDETRFPRRRAATLKLWMDKPSMARAAMMADVEESGGPKGKNPYFYVQEFDNPQPAFLKGNEEGDLVQVRYNGLYKICTRATMELFGLEYVRDW